MAARGLGELLAGEADAVIPGLEEGGGTVDRVQHAHYYKARFTIIMMTLNVQNAGIEQ